MVFHRMLIFVNSDSQNINAFYHIYYTSTNKWYEEIVLFILKIMDLI